MLLQFVCGKAGRISLRYSWPLLDTHHFLENLSRRINESFQCEMKARHLFVVFQQLATKEGISIFQFGDSRFRRRSRFKSLFQLFDPHDLPSTKGLLRKPVAESLVFGIDFEAMIFRWPWDSISWSSCSCFGSIHLARVTKGSLLVESEHGYSTDEVLCPQTTSTAKHQWRLGFPDPSSMRGRSTALSVFLKMAYFGRLLTGILPDLHLANRNNGA